VKEILDKGLLGELLYARVDFHISPRPEDYNRDLLPWRLMPEIAGAGYFYDLACHQFDLLEWYFGKPLDVAGKGFNRRGLYDPEDTVFARISYDSGLPLSGQWCFAASEVDHMDTIRIFGTKGSLEFSTFDFTPIRHFSEEGIVEFLPKNPENIQYWFIKNMVEELQEIRPAKANSDSAVLTNWTMDRILEKL
jgi:predicted dehydrogenase